MLRSSLKVEVLYCSCFEAEGESRQPESLGKPNERGYLQLEKHLAHDFRQSRLSLVCSSSPPHQNSEPLRGTENTQSIRI